MDLEPGPFADRDALVLPPRVVVDGLFEGLFALVADPLGSMDAPLSDATHAIGDDVPTDLDASYAATVGVAEDAHASQAVVGTGSDADTLTGAGENADTLRRSVLRYLPQPDAPIDTGFVEPPDAGLVHLGRGFDTPGRRGPDQPVPDDTSRPADTPEQRVRRQIRQLYLALLNREPDDGGWDFYTSWVVDEGHTIDEVEAAIKGSSEYKQLHGG